MEKQDKFLTTIEVAKLFEVTDRTIRRHIEMKLLPAIALSSRHWLIKESDLGVYKQNLKNRKKVKIKVNK